MTGGARALRALVAVVVLGVLASTTLTACTARKGSAQKAGERIDRALGTNQD